MDQDGTTNNDSKKEDENKDKTAVNTNNDNIMKPNETANSTAPAENNNSKDSETKQLKIMLSGFVRSEYDELEAMVKELGAEVTSQANFATHLVMPKMGRTISFLCAISYVKFILKPSWIRQSHKEKKLLGKPFLYFSLFDKCSVLVYQILFKNFFMGKKYCFVKYFLLCLITKTNFGLPIFEESLLMLDYYLTLKKNSVALDW